MALLRPVDESGVARGRVARGQPGPYLGPWCLALVN